MATQEGDTDIIDSQFKLELGEDVDLIRISFTLILSLLVPSRTRPRSVLCLVSRPSPAFRIPTGGARGSSGDSCWCMVGLKKKGAEQAAAAVGQSVQERV